ncbi:uncharacterized protein B0T23DRAFT_211450 [Neurospora hispaniola]|uniref:Uncharacterized protein n=1 Tax=Neurospora hispaniola TaxID=588809 RepID=A0AAJ0I1L0_9PEZI|nr:hypothetical protein B0T23DRAFT_211450 [Neurospora hispaniola]
MARGSEYYRPQQGAAESEVGYAGRKGLDRAPGCGTSGFALMARPGRLCTPVECTRMAKSVGIRGGRWGDGAKGLVDGKGKAKKRAGLGQRLVLRFSVVFLSFCVF